MTLATGLRLGPYEITGRVGAGGMGEVALAVVGAACAPSSILLEPR
jgi:hypothetical protein